MQTALDNQAFEYPVSSLDITISTSYSADDLTESFIATRLTVKAGDAQLQQQMYALTIKNFIGSIYS